MHVAVHVIEAGWLRIINNKTKVKYINLCDHQNRTIDIVADADSPVMNDIRIFSIGCKNLSFSDNQKNFSPFTANSSTSNRPILVFLSYRQVNYMATEAHTENFQGLASF